ncbi:MAG: calcium/proton exchanger [Syntrophobacterales bacterium]|jgi:Ca2+:H+ antiporter
MLNKIFTVLLIFTPAALVAKYLHFSPLVLFVLSALAIVPLAKFLGDGTEALAAHTSPALGGILNATFGNATELIISLFALRAGLSELVKASITGSIIGNLLLILGGAIFAGGLKYKIQRFNQTMARAIASTLLLAAIALIIPAIFLQTAPRVGDRIIEEMSIFVAVFMLIVYFAGLLFTLHTHKDLSDHENQASEGPGWSLKKSFLILGLTTLAVALMSEILVSSIEVVIKDLGWTELFLGVIVIAIIGNAAEHTSAVMMAVKNKMDIALQISIGSATQIVMFVAPILVLVSLFFKEPMSLIFNNFELAAIIFAVLISNLVTADGESNWLEGVQLLMAYAIMAVGFFFIP